MRSIAAAFTLEKYLSSPEGSRSLHHFEVRASHFSEADDRGLSARDQRNVSLRSYLQIQLLKVPPLLFMLYTFFFPRPLESSSLFAKQSARPLKRSVNTKDARRRPPQSLNMSQLLVVVSLFTNMTVKMLVVAVTT